MAGRNVIVDGSNIATEGRSTPSLAQLDQAVREFLAENPNDEVTVVVDASFGHRIDASEVSIFEQAESAGELVSPPAGAIGRGDAFLLRIAEKTGATVLSNDSFQEFHGEHAWLFDKGRLVGGKPVPGIGWIFMARTPVRGQKSREVVKEAKRKKKVEDSEVTVPVASDGAKPGGRAKKVVRAIAQATEEAVDHKAVGRRRRKVVVPPSQPVNDPLPFITFIATHRLGSEVVGTVAEFSSHGAFINVDGTRCYLPLSAMGDPPPRRAREVVSKGETRAFVVQALDPLRRGVELAIPGFAKIAGEPTEETVEAEIHELVEPPKRRRTSKEPAASKKTVAKKVPASKKAAAPKKPAAQAARAKEPTAKEPTAKEATAKKAVAKKAVAKKAAAKNAASPARPAAKKSVAKQPADGKATAKKAPAKRSTSKKAVSTS